MKYKIISTTRIEALEKLINEKIEQGWALHGGIFAFNHTLNQAMIKDKIIEPVKKPAQVKTRRKASPADENPPA